MVIDVKFQNKSTGTHHREVRDWAQVKATSRWTEPVTEKHNMWSCYLDTDQTLLAIIQTSFLNIW